VRQHPALRPYSLAHTPVCARFGSAAAAGDPPTREPVACPPTGAWTPVLLCPPVLLRPPTGQADVGPILLHLGQKFTRWPGPPSPRPSRHPAAPVFLLLSEAGARRHRRPQRPPPPLPCASAAITRPGHCAPQISSAVAHLAESLTGPSAPPRCTGPIDASHP
jgi:hypothetical protein